MAKLRGTINGQKFEDLRVLIPEPIKSHYEKRGEWESIVRYRSYEYTEVITVKITQGFRRDKWKQYPWNPGSGSNWYIDDDEFIWGTSMSRY